MGYWRCDSAAGGWTPNGAAAGWVGAGIVAGATLQADTAPLQPEFVVSRRDVAVPENGFALVGVRLDRAPSAPVTTRVRKLAGDPNLTVDATAILTFNAGNWQNDQLIRITASADPDAVDGVATFSIEGTGVTSATVNARELDSDAVDPRIESSQRDGDKLLTDTLNEYR